MGFVVVDGVLDLGFLGGITGFAGLVQLAEQHAELTGISLAQEGVQLFHQRSYSGLLMHGLVGQRTELGTQRSNHPARQVQVFLVGGAEVLLDGDQLLLTDETVPATQRLSVLGLVLVELGHVAAHDVGRVLGDFQARLEPILDAHASGRLSIDLVPRAARSVLNALNGGDFVLVL